MNVYPTKIALFDRYHLRRAIRYNRQSHAQQQLNLLLVLPLLNNRAFRLLLTNGLLLRLNESKKNVHPSKVRISRTLILSRVMGVAPSGHEYVWLETYESSKTSSNADTAGTNSAPTTKRLISKRRVTFIKESSKEGMGDAEGISPLTRRC